jgi:hypothetical protein
MQAVSTLWRAAREQRQGASTQRPSARTQAKDFSKHLSAFGAQRPAVRWKPPSFAKNRRLIENQGRLPREKVRQLVDKRRLPL